MKEEITRIEGYDGPTAVFIAGRNKENIALRQRIQRFINRTRRKYIENHIKAEPHTINQVYVTLLAYLFKSCCFLYRLNRTQIF